MKKLTLLALLAVLSAPAFSKNNNPVVEETENGHILLLPEDLTKFLNKEFPKYRMPNDADMNPEMTKYYYTQLIGVHPAVAWGDFNGDKKRDYALLIVTGESPWGPLVELVVLNGKGRDFDTYRLGEVYGAKDDYVKFSDGKLYKGKFQKGGWYINWDKKSNTYVTIKS